MDRKTITDRVVYLYKLIGLDPVIVRKNCDKSTLGEVVTFAKEMEGYLTVKGIAFTPAH